MKRNIIFLFVIICVLFQVVGCNKDKTKNSTSDNQKKEIKLKVTEKDIREIAYKWLDDNYKKTVVDWVNGEVSEYHAIKHTVISHNQPLTLVNQDTYKVTFKTNNEGILGPIVLYVDKNSGNVLGGDLLRD